MGGADGSTVLEPPNLCLLVALAPTVGYATVPSAAESYTCEIVNTSGCVGREKGRGERRGRGGEGGKGG